MRLTAVLILFTLFVFSSACSEKKNDKSSAKETAKTENDFANGIHKAEILKFQDVPQYTYLFVKEGDSEFWIAVTTTNVNAGETVYFSNPLEMRNFHSSALDTTFETILFVNSIARSADALSKENKGKARGMTGMVSPHEKMTESKKKNQPAEKTSEPFIEKSADELTVAQIIEKSADFNGKEITIKGKVTKFLPDIMKKNWIHIQDGTSYNGKTDLVSTTKETFEVGDIVTIKAKLETNIDYGYGYKYEVILQDAVKIK